jgi:hypothetical protein
MQFGNGWRNAQQDVAAGIGLAAALSGHCEFGCTSCRACVVNAILQNRFGRICIASEPMFRSAVQHLRQVLHRISPGLLAALRGEDAYRSMAEPVRPENRISLLSVVREKSGGRLMGVEQIEGAWADCAWIEHGMRQKRRFSLNALEVVPALTGDEYRWREAFRAASHQKVG